MYTDWEVPQIYLVVDMVDSDDEDMNFEDEVYKIAVHNAAKNAADLEAERDLVFCVERNVWVDVVPMGTYPAPNQS